MQTDRVPLSQVEDKTVKVGENIPVNTNFDSKVSFLDDIEYHRTADNFDISYEDRKEQDIADKLSFLFDWGKEVTGKDDRVTILTELKALGTRLGLQTTGKELIKKLYQWTRLDQQRRKTEKEMDLISKGEKNVKPT